MNTLRKIKKNAKALSPVIASIILIAVTVAVSIAVAAWMGGMTIGFMGTTETLNVGNPWGWTTDTVYINVTNSGGSTVTLTSPRIGNEMASFTVDYNGTTTSSSLGTLTMKPGDRAGLLIAAPAGGNFTTGIPCTITLVTQGNKEFSVTGTPPST
jgi:flagellin-like protein